MLPKATFGAEGPWAASSNIFFFFLVLCIGISEAQRFRGGRQQGRRRGRQEGEDYLAPEAADEYASPSEDVPVYEGGVPVYGADDAAGDDPLAALANNIPGVPGEDYPIFDEVPESGFACEGQVDGGRAFFFFK